MEDGTDTSYYIAYETAYCLKEFTELYKALENRIPEEYVDVLRKAYYKKREEALKLWKEKDNYEHY